MIRLGTGDLSAVLPGVSPCGRTNMRIKGWMGRADQTTKVKGMFVHPEQIAEVADAPSRPRRLRLVVGREGEQDTMTLLAECAATRCLAGRLGRRDPAGGHQAQGRGEAGGARHAAQRRQGDRRRTAGRLKRLTARADCRSIAAMSDTSSKPSGHPAIPPRRIGVLLVNLGTPDGTDYWSVRRYLKEFLSDRRVIEENRVKWWLALNLVILTIRPGRKGRDYAKIWNRERNESPLKTITRAQAEKLADALPDRSLTIDWAMRYGNPSIASRLDALVAQGCERILVVPLYPQYAAATTATVADEVFRALSRMRFQPALRVAAPYYAEPIYIDALATSLDAALAKLPFKPDVILASFHGIPEAYVAKGEPYQRHCVETTELLRRKLNLVDKALMLTFQSRFGPTEWLKPYTDATVKALAEKGVKNLAVITPGFAADCLETLEEIAMENAEIFRHAGGENFAAIPCLNDSEGGMAVIRDVVLRELKGWI